MIKLPTGYNIELTDNKLSGYTEVQLKEIHRLERIIKRETILSYIASGLSISAFIAGIYLMVNK